MIKLILMGLWGALLTAAGFLLTDNYKLFESAATHAESQVKLDTVTTNVMRVPIMANEKPSGYVLLDLAIDYDAVAAAAFASKMKSIAVDEAFRAVYESVSVDFRHAKKTDLTALLKEVGTRLNTRLGKDIVKEVRVNEFLFAPSRSSQ